MRRNPWSEGVLAVVLGLGSASSVNAQERRRPERPTRRAEAISMVSGRVETLLKNKHGDVDGFRLIDGGEVHFPPHVGKQLDGWIDRGDKVEVDGREETRPKGEVVFEATRIESQARSLKIDKPKGKPGHGRGPRDEESMDAKGKGKAFVTSPKGDVDGLVLDDETAVKFPPHRRVKLQKFANEGDRASVEGRRHETPKGQIHHHADQIADVNTGKAVDRDEPVPGGPKGRGPKGKPTRGREMGPSNAEILRELQAVRRLLEKH